MLQTFALTQLSASGRGSSHHDLLRLRRRLLGRGAAHLRRAAVRLRCPDHQETPAAEAAKMGKPKPIRIHGNVDCRIRKNYYLAVGTTLVLLLCISSDFTSRMYRGTIEE